MNIFKTKKAVKAKHEYYTSFDTIPVLNYFKLSTDNELRYLLVDLDYNFLPEKFDNEKLMNAYKILSLNIKEVDMTLQSAYSDALLEYHNFLETGNESKVHNIFNRYCNTLDKYYSEYKYDNQIFNNATSLRNYIRELFVNVHKKTFYEYVYARYSIMDYNVMDAKSRGEWDLYSDIVAIKELTGIEINEFTCTMSKFISVKNLANKRLKAKLNKESSNK